MFSRRWLHLTIGLTAVATTYQLQRIDHGMTYTTNAEDQAEAAKLKDRIARSNAAVAADLPTNPAWVDIPSVSIDEGAHKYVLISATEPAPRADKPSPRTRFFVRSKRGAAYHRNVAEPFIYTLETHGFGNVQILGGGRIFLDRAQKRVSIFGYSYGFGQADHALSKSVIDEDERFKGYNVTWSNNGY